MNMLLILLAGAAVALLVVGVLVIAALVGSRSKQKPPADAPMSASVPPLSELAAPAPALSSTQEAETPYRKLYK